MSAAVSYLEQEKIEELATQFGERGYTVTFASGEHRGYDLVASKGDQRIAFEVTALSSLARDRTLIHELRRRAFDEGFTDFRLVVVSPPRQTAVSVPGLERELEEYLRDHLPRDLQSLASNVRIESVSNLEIVSLSVTEAGIDLAGAGVVEVTLEYGESRDGVEGPDDFPFRFHVLLGHDQHLVKVEELAVDLSSVAEAE